MTSLSSLALVIREVINSSDFVYKSLVAFKDLNYSSVMHGLNAKWC